MLAVVNAPLYRPHPVKGDGSQCEAGGKHKVIVQNHPEAAQDLAERPVAVHDVDGVQVHGGKCN